MLYYRTAQTPTSIIIMYYYIDANRTHFRRPITHFPFVRFFFSFVIRAAVGHIRRCLFSVTIIIK